MLRDILMPILIYSPLMCCGSLAHHTRASVRMKFKLNFPESAYAHDSLMQRAFEYTIPIICRRYMNMLSALTIEFKIEIPEWRLTRNRFKNNEKSRKQCKMHKIRNLSGSRSNNIIFFGISQQFLYSSISTIELMLLFQNETFRCINRSRQTVRTRSNGLGHRFWLDALIHLVWVHTIARHCTQRTSSPKFLVHRRRAEHHHNIWIMYNNTNIHLHSQNARTASKQGSERAGRRAHASNCTLLRFAMHAAVVARSLCIQR